MKRIRHISVSALILILADQIIKVPIASFCMESDVALIENVLFFRPVQNTHLWWIGSLLDIHMSAFLLVLILGISIAFVVFISIYLIYLSEKRKKLIYVFLVFAVAGIVCMMIDIIFWIGSIDYIKLFDWFVFDLKDVYTKIAMAFLALWFIYYMKYYMKSTKEERKQHGLLSWFKKGFPLSQNPD